jgi:hypothetical protein
MFDKRSYFHGILLLVAMGGMMSCADKADNKVSSEPSGPLPMSQRLAESGGFKQDEHGNWVPKSNKRSSFEGQRANPSAKGSIEKKAYEAGEYKKKSWWGKKSYEAEAYKGNTDGSRFQVKAKQDMEVSQFADQKMPAGGPYKTTQLDYESARESDADRLAKPRNDYSESRRRKYVQPPIIDWEEQRKMSMEKSRSILGR